MTPSLGEWIHNFTVTETQTHKRGYTIYKITSVVFPRSVPQALTCLTVWKRFHDVKRLHRELSRRYKSMKLSGELPVPTDASFFKRFDAVVIQRRKEYILQLLDFAAQHPVLYKCHAFAQFFSDAQALALASPSASPQHQLHQKEKPGSGIGGGGRPGAIAEICDKLDLLYDPHDDGLTLLDPERDKLEEGNDNNIILNQTMDSYAKPPEQEINVEEEQKAKQQTITDYTRFLTPMASIESDDSDYIYEAALEFSQAVQAEANLEYLEAHIRYKRGVEVLLNGSKDDSNDDRRFIAKAKISKYVARADDIYDKFLRGEGVADCVKTNFQLSIDVTDSQNDSSELYLERPWNNLAKYKVLQVLGDRVMQVQCITEPRRPTYVMKGIEKPPSNTQTQTIFLPQHVPYMVALLAFFQSEQKIFLLLKQAEGGRLYDYIQSYKPTVCKTTNLGGLFPEILDASPAEADISRDAIIPSVQHSCFVDCSNAMQPPDAPHVELPTENTEFNELVRYSQQLLESVSNTLMSVRENDEVVPPKVVGGAKKEDFQMIDLPIAETKMHQRTNIPEASLKQWARELLVAIQCLHEKGIILGDLHMDNLLLGAKGQLLLTYFYQNEGLAIADNHIHKAYSVTALSGHFVAPERPLTFKSDWWSYGVVLYQLLLGLPFKAAHPGHIDIYGCIQYPEHVAISDCARDLLDNLLQQAPEDRLDYEQIKAHIFFDGTNWQEVRRNGMNSATTNFNASAALSNAGS